jgi:hypothetical protein
MTIDIQQEDGLNIIHIDDYKKFHSELSDIRAAIKTRILLYFVVKRVPTSSSTSIEQHELGMLQIFVLLKI